MVDVSPSFFSFLMLSPLFEETDENRISRNTVIALGEKNSGAVPVSHVAVYLNPYILFHKENPTSESHFTLISSKTFARNYFNSIYPEKKFFHMKRTLDSYFAENFKYIDSEMTKILSDLIEDEKQLSQYILTRRDDPEFPFYDNTDDKNKSALAEKWAKNYDSTLKTIRKRNSNIFKLADTRIKDLTKSSSRQQTEFATFFWNLIQFRSFSLSKQKGPFD